MRSRSVPGDARAPEEIERQRKRESLLLQRVRVIHDLENSHNPRYQETLRRGLAWLDEELAKLGP